MSGEDKTLPAGTLAYIEDGYSECGYIEAELGQHPAIRFEFRRMTGDEVRAYKRELDRVNKDDMMAMRRLGAAGLVKSVSWWSLERPDGMQIPIDVDFLVNRLKPEVYSRLVQITSGQTPSDLDPEWEADAGEVSAASGKLSSGEIEEARAKNL